MAVSNLFKEALYENSVYDELMVVRPPKRVLGGVTVSSSRRVVAGITRLRAKDGERRSPFFSAVLDSIKLDDTF